MSHIKDRLKQYKDEYSKYGKYDGLYVADVLEMLEQLQGALEQDEKENGWIPVSEKMPDKRDWCLAVFRESDTEYQLIPRVAEFVNRPDDEHATADGWHIIDFFEGAKEYIKLLKCVAWMPLPEPYKGGLNGKM